VNQSNQIATSLRSSQSQLFLGVYYNLVFQFKLLGFVEFIELAKQEEPPVERLWGLLSESVEEKKVHQSVA
jgi:hypothetical protein